MSGGCSAARDVRGLPGVSVLGNTAGFGCGVPDPAVFGTSFVSAADPAALGPASSPPAARCRCAGGIY